jgi:hypothetical protein
VRRQPCDTLARSPLQHWLFTPDLQWHGVNRQFRRGVKYSKRSLARSPEAARAQSPPPPSPMTRTETLPVRCAILPLDCYCDSGVNINGAAPEPERCPCALLCCSSQVPGAWGDVIHTPLREIRHCTNNRNKQPILKGGVMSRQQATTVRYATLPLDCRYNSGEPSGAISSLGCYCEQPVIQGQTAATEEITTGNRCV